MNIEIQNCNNIDTGTISLAENKLNIRFAANGTGKSTIARAIELSKKGEALTSLMPFKLLADNPENREPSIVGLDAFESVMCFNEEYVSQFVYKEDELVSNSFDIFIRTDAYKQREQEIEELVSEIKKLFAENDELDSLIKTLTDMGAAFKLTKSGISKSCTGMKGLATGNKIAHIPEGLEAYKPFIQSDDSVGWVDWQTKGCAFSELSDSCPFCTSPVADKKEQITKVGQEYDKNTVKNLLAIINIVDLLGDYFSEGARDRLTTITRLQGALEDEHEAFLVTVKTQIDNLVTKLEMLKTLSAFQFKEGEQVADKLPSYKLDLEFFSELRSEKTQEAITPINASIDHIIEKAGQLQGKINQQRIGIQRVVEKHQKDINDFLSYAGFSYAVEITGDGENARLKLLHVDHTEHLAGGNQHLSFGERNAFAIVLFMYEALSKKPELIILDDPISSFDKNKKYAIFEMLFRRDASACLKSKTVLMLTHDVEPIIDTIKSLSHKFGNQTSAAFLNLRKGQVSEVEIKRDDIQTFSQICKTVLSSDADVLIKLIYLRRNLEIIDNKGDAYQVLSNLLHKRERAIDTREAQDAAGEHPEMNTARFTGGCAEIADELPGFVYAETFNRICESDELKTLYVARNNECVPSCPLPVGCANGLEQNSLCLMERCLC